MSYVFSRFEQLKASGALPSPSGVALEILRLTQSEDTTTAQLAHVLHADPALAGRLVKFANSTQAGATRPVVAIGDAVKLLGFAVVRQLCLGFSVLNAHRGGLCPGFDYSRYWARSLATALAAQVFCIKVRVLAPEESFTCGLLADIGSLALAALYPERFSQILATGATGPDLASAEREAFGADHLEFSAALLEDWRLPKICIDAVFHSEQPGQTGFEAASRPQMLCEVIALSRRVGEYFVADLDTRKRIAPNMLLCAAKVGVDAEVLAQMCDSVGEGWQRWGEVLSVKTGEPPAFDLCAPPAPDPVVAAAGVPALSLVVAPAAAADPLAAAGAADSAVAGAPGISAAASTIPILITAAVQTDVGPQAGSPVTASSRPAVPQTLAIPTAVGLTVQVLGDDPFCSGRLRDLLVAAGHRAIVHAVPELALGAALERMPDVMIIDLAGVADRATGVCATLRATSIGQRLYILGTIGSDHPAGTAALAVTSLDGTSAGVAFAGPDDYLSKPFDRAGLDLRMRAARRTMALREALQREQDDLRKLASKLAIANRRLQRSALTDALTGLPNQRYAYERLEQEWLTSTRSQRPLSCMTIDIDHFQRLNAAHGHEAADKALGLVATVLRESARASDVICRLAGEVFLVISPDADRGAAVKSAERLRIVVEQRLGNEGRSSPARAASAVTVSIGVATRDPAVADSVSLLRLSGEALAIAKAEGHNRVRTSFAVHPPHRAQPARVPG